MPTYARARVRVCMRVRACACVRGRACVREPQLLQPLLLLLVLIYGGVTDAPRPTKFDGKSIEYSDKQRAALFSTPCWRSIWKMAAVSTWRRAMY